MSIEYRQNKPYIKYRLRFENNKENYMPPRWFYEYCYPTFTNHVNSQGTSITGRSPIGLLNETNTIPEFIAKVNEMIFVINCLINHDHGVTSTENWIVVDSDENFMALTERIKSNANGGLKFIMDIVEK